MTDDFLSPDDHTLPEGDDERLEEDVGLDVEDDRDDEPGISGPEHLGLTPPG